MISDFLVLVGPFLGLGVVAYGIGYAVGMIWSTFTGIAEI